MLPETKTLCLNLVEALKERLNQPDFPERHRRSDKDFVRQRCLPFVAVVLFLLNLLKQPLQDELDDFFNLNRGEAVAPAVVTKSAFSRARQKLKAEAFIELNRVQVDCFYADFPIQTWQGFRLLAVDGSTVQLPATPDTIEHFGLWHTTPVARVSQLFDTLNKVTVEALIGPKTEGEREFAARHLEKAGPDDLVLLDRGYPAFWLFALIRQRKADFCARMPAGVWAEVDRFIASGLSEQIIALSPCRAAQEECRARRLSTAPLAVRLVRIELENGDLEVLVSSLLDRERFPATVFKELYHHRWPVEESYKVMKYRIEVENWSGKSPLSVYQDFYAKVFTMNLTAILAHPAQTVVKQQSLPKKYTYQVNFTHALSKMKDTVVRLFRQSTLSPIPDSLWQAMTHTIEPIRPNRKCPRKKSIKTKTFPMAHKSIR